MTQAQNYQHWANEGFCLPLSPFRLKPHTQSQSSVHLLNLGNLVTKVLPSVISPLIIVRLGLQVLAQYLGCS